MLFEVHLQFEFMAKSCLTNHPAVLPSRNLFFLSFLHNHDIFSSLCQRRSNENDILFCSSAYCFQQELRP